MLQIPQDTNKEVTQLLVKTGIDDINTKTGSLTETAPANDTASSGLNGRLQRIAQRISSLIALLPTALGGSGGLKVESVLAKDPTYSASITGLLSVATATDIFTIRGSASKTVNVLKIMISATRSTTGFNDILLVKRSTANTGGTSTNPTAVPHDSADAAATAVVDAYTANPTVGTLVGQMKSQKAFLNTAAGSGAGSVIQMQDGVGNGEPIAVLRGVAQSVSINLNGVTITSGNFNIYVEWTETP